MTDEDREEKRLERAKRRLDRMELDRDLAAKGKKVEVQQGEPRPIDPDRPPTDDTDDDPPDTPEGDTPWGDPPPEEDPPDEDDGQTIISVDPLLRTRRIAFNITGVWEGSQGYANYQNYDAGIISYGKHQVTLASGNLSIVVNDYLNHAAPDSQAAATLRTYAASIEARDASLRNDDTLKEALIAAAAEQAMRDAQDRTIINGFWNTSQRSANMRGLIFPLTHAFLFDAAIQHGPYHPYLGRAEEALNVPERTPVRDSGVSEEDFATRVAEERLKAMRDFAARTGLNGVIPRAQFWVDIMKASDWQLEGDAEGIIYVKTRPVVTRL